MSEHQWVEIGKWRSIIRGSHLGSFSGGFCVEDEEWWWMSGGSCVVDGE